LNARILAREALEERTVLSALVSIGDAEVMEADTGTTQLVFDVELQSNVPGGVSFNYGTMDGTAVAGEDYVAASGSLNFAGTAGEIQQVAVDVIGDNIVEDNETLTLAVTDPDNSGQFTGDWRWHKYRTWGWGVDVGDLDGDGDLDGFGAFPVGYREIGAFFNNGTGDFTAGPIERTPTGRPQEVALGDLDGDSDLDVFIACEKGGDLVYFNDGSGVFTDSGASYAGGNSYDVELADLDADGDLDAFVGINGANRVWLNDGTGQFIDSGQRLGTSTTWAIDLGDGDGDGDLDAFVANKWNWGPKQPNRVWLNDGDGNFTDSGQRLGLSSSVDLGLGDLDGDGDLDAFVRNNDWKDNGDNPDRVYFNQGDGTFVDSGQRHSESDRNWGLTLGDIDGDGDLDAFTVSDNAGNYPYINQGGSQGGTEGDFVRGPAATGRYARHGKDVSRADLDGDGDLDAFVAGQGGHGTGVQVLTNQIDPATATGTILNDDSLNEPPSLTLDTDPVEVFEGQTATNTGTVSDPDGDTVSLSASAGAVTNNNGTWSWSLPTDDGPADGTSVTIEGDDGNGGTAQVSFTLIVTNVAPDASITGPASGLKGDPLTFDLSATDVSAADQAADFTYVVNWGDGSPVQTIVGAADIEVDHEFIAAGATTVIVTATDKDGGQSAAFEFDVNVIQPVDVDVKPGNAKNNVNAKSNGVIPVAIYTTADFDATTIDGNSVLLSSADPEDTGIAADHFALEDVDGDGDLDMILHFRTQDVLAALGLDLDPGESETANAELTGETVDAVMLQGFDTIDFFMPGNGKAKGKK